MNRLLKAVLVGLIVLVSAGVRAATNTSDITDMWWNPAESGWGVNIVQQNDTAFVTFFVYDNTQTAIWYTSDVHFRGSSGGAFVWTGNLYATKGPWFGGRFSSSNVTARAAGTVSLTFTNLSQGTLTYSVDGVTVTKQIERQTWTTENYTGQYLGGFSIRQSVCNPGYYNGINEQAGVVSVTHNGSSVVLVLANNVATCTFNGTYAQTGKLGNVQGTYGCSDGTRGNFIAIEMTPTISGFTARVAGQSQYCQWSGYMGGIARAQ